MAHSVFIINSLAEASSLGTFSTDILINTALSGTIKIGGSFIFPNPITLTSGLFDIFVLAYIVVPVYMQTAKISILMENNSNQDDVYYKKSNFLGKLNLIPNLT